MDWRRQLATDLRSLRGPAGAEVITATHVRAFGAWWQASARHRLGKFSGEYAAPLKRGAITPCPQSREEI